MKLIISFILALLLSNNLLAANKNDFYVESMLYFVANDHSKAPRKIVGFKQSEGMSEIHSNPEYTLLPGGIWNLEIRLKESNKVNVLFWIKDKDKPEINQDIDVSNLNLSSMSILKFDEGELRLNVIPKLIEPELDPTQLTVDNFGLNHFCFNNSSVIIDGNYYMGKFSGFGERLLVGFPEFYDIELSLKPLRNWKPIGKYQDGIINIDINDEHIFTMLRVGIGPSGYEKGGPFIIYGEIRESSDSKARTLEIEEKYMLKDISSTHKNIILKASKQNPYTSISRGTIGTDYDSGPYVIYAIGNELEGQHCG